MASASFSNVISGGLHIGKQIFIQGSIPTNSDGFSINLKCGSGPKVDHALHFNPRFSQNCVVRNSYEEGAWKNEEKHGSLPFHRNQAFEIIIFTEDSHFKILVNGHHFTEFQHRIPIHRISHLDMSSGVTVSMIQYNPPPVPQYGFGDQSQQMYKPGQIYAIV